MSRYLGVAPAKEGLYYFVSYIAEDQDRVSEYVKLLDRSGVPVWYDYGLEYGAQWETAIGFTNSTGEHIIK